MERNTPGKAGLDSGKRARLAYSILSKALNTSRLVRVQRPVTRAGKTFMSHRWVKPECVKKTDKVIGNHAVYEQWKKEQSGKVAAQTKPGTTAGTTSKPIGTAKLNAVLAKKRKAKADAARVSTTAQPAKPTPSAAKHAKAAKSVQPAKPAKAPQAPKSGATSKPAPKQPAAKQKTASKTAANKADAQKAGKTDTQKASASSDSKAAGKKARASKAPVGGDKDQLAPSLATTEREKNILAAINRISDPRILQTAIDTGIVAEDAETHAFASEKLLTAYNAYHIGKPDNLEENVLNVKNSLTAEFHGTKLRGLNLTPRQSIAASRYREGIEDAISHAIGSADAATLMIDPCETIGIMQFVKPQGGRDFNSFSAKAWLSTHPGVMQDTLKHIGDTQPELKAEAEKMLAEYDAMENVDGGRQSVEQALGGLFRQPGTTAEKDDKTRKVAMVMKFFGAAYVDDAGHEITNYGYLSIADMRRLHQKAVASPEREAVLMNLVIAFRTMGMAALIPGEPETMDLPTYSMDFMKLMKEYRDTMPIEHDLGSIPAHIARSRMCAMRYAKAVPKGRFFADDPSPFKDILYNALKYASTGYIDLQDETEHVPFDGTALKQLKEQNAPKNMSLKKLREQAFRNATCTIRACTDDEQQAAFDQMDEEQYESLGRNKDHFEDRHIIRRRAYRMENSEMEEAFWKLVNEEGLDVHDAYNGISYNGFCAVCKSGSYRIPKGDKDCAAGAMLGFGIYEAYSMLKSMMYAGSRPFAGEELLYDENEGYSDGFEADGVLCLIKSTYGKVSEVFDHTTSARVANKNMGGNCDSVRCNAGSNLGRLMADEACLTAANMMFPSILVDISSRMDAKK